MFCLSSKAKNALCDVRSYSCRVLSAVFAGNPTTTVIVAYSPTNVSDENDVKEFYDTLRAAIHDTSAHNFLTVLGDFNARLGPEDAWLPFHDSTNRNGQYLADLLIENNLLAANTCFQKRLGKRWTFQDRGTKAKRQLDYLLVRKKWRNSILNAEAYSSFSSLGSDHRVVSMRVRLSLRAPKPRTKQPLYDWKLFAAKPDLQAQYNIEVRNRFHLLEDEECRDPTERYQRFIAANKTATEKCVPRRAESRKPLRSRNPEIVKAREMLKEAQAAASDHQVSHAVDEARATLYDTYDRLMAEDLEEKVARVEQSNASGQCIVRQNGAKKGRKMFTW